MLYRRGSVPRKSRDCSVCRQEEVMVVQATKFFRHHREHTCIAHSLHISCFYSSVKLMAHSSLHTRAQLEVLALAAILFVP